MDADKSLVQRERFYVLQAITLPEKRYFGSVKMDIHIQEMGYRNGIGRGCNSLADQTFYFNFEIVGNAEQQAHLLTGKMPRQGDHQ